MKVVIVGGVAGGATTATRLRRLDETIEIVLIEKNNYISYANCGLPYYIGNVIKDKDDLLVQTPENLKKTFNIDVRLSQEVVSINRCKKSIIVKDLKENNTYEETYDKLVLSTGATPINPFINLPKEKVKTLRNIEDAEEIKKYIKNNNIKNIAIIGGGYIGIEIAENLCNYEDIKVNIIEKSSHLITSIDNDMANFVNKILNEHNVNIILNNGVKEIINKDDSLNIIFDKDEMLVDFIICSIGVKPEDNLAKNAGLMVYSNGGIVVNNKMQTSDENIYAVGDAVKIKNCITEDNINIFLAGPANKQARVVANNICNIKTNYSGSIGSSILKIFDYNLGITGINEKTCNDYNINYKTMIISPFSHATYYPGANILTIKAIYENQTGKILGAQIFGKEGTDKITDILSTAIKMEMTAYDLETLDLCYAPPFSSAKSPINLLGNSIANELEKLVSTITWDEVINLEKDSNVIVLDVRTREEYIVDNYKGTLNIPLDELREKLNELDKTKTYLVYCKTGHRSYNACRLLSQNGYKVKNIIGGYIMYYIR